MVFLAGSIEMGEAEDWQTRVSRELQQRGYVVLNPRRDDWDSSWTQSIHNPEFSGQVNWELDGLTHAAMILFYFSPGTKSPVTMLEFGIAIASSDADIVCVCPPGFWRKGNIDIVAARRGVKVYESLDEALVENFKG